MDETVNRKTTIIIADDTVLFAEGVEQIINNMRAFCVTGKASNGRMLMQLLHRLRPDLILLDIKMPLTDGLETSLFIKKNFPKIKVILMSLYFEPAYKTFIRKNDIDGFISKDIDAVELQDVLQKINAGEKVFICPQQIEPSVHAITPDTEFMKLYKLTKTEIEIMQLIAQGNSTKMIAYKRGLSKFTVEVHRKNIFRKLNAKNMADVIAFAIKHQLSKK